MFTTSLRHNVSFTEALLYWLKLGFISFGGPAGQIALMHTELVEKRRWISERRFLHALNYCMLLPGPEATQLAIYIGWLMHGTLGGIIAGALFVLPSLVILIALSWIYLAFGHVGLVAGILYGIKPAVVAIVLAAAWRIGSRTLKNGWLMAIALAAFVAIAIVDVPFPFIVLGAALVGMIGGKFAPDVFKVGGGHKQANVAEESGPAIIDDHTPTPEHAGFSWGKLFRVTLIGIAMGIVSWSMLVAVFGKATPLVQMSWFFTKAALLTFGGAYAVLPYVYQGGVETYQWLTAAQMIDGLALGETTPGPLIMIVAFIGFVGAWTKTVLGPESLVLAGILGACVTTWFTFLPSFVFILAGGPVVEATRDKIRLTAPLTAISAAVVGVILSLAVFFAEHVFKLSQPLMQWDVVAIALAAASCIALLRYKLGTISLLTACAIVGLVVSSFH
ncbi:chromate transporter [Paucimonas lemoignei]|uniref:Chromate transporter n=1 Tax=Paucimonas lemoignei TaxID=29443 RepID=A0A4R3HQS5_PAULE|nr:chromate efflux transporter [Paucimonas lemoignei]TCS34359.1 chromate transporter [Paucimonas lemoignei]